MATDARAPGWRPGQRVVFVNGSEVYPGTIIGHDPESGERYWLVEWDDGEEIDGSFAEADLLFLSKEDR